jgi:hypothetical protein
MERGGPRWLIQWRIRIALGCSCSVDRALAMQGDELVLSPLSRQQERMDRRLPRQNFPLNLLTNRRLCSTVGGRIVEGWTAHCCAVSAARSRAATMTNLARSSLALVLPALFGAAKSCALVNFFVIRPPDGRLVARRPHPTTNNFAQDRGHLMACLTEHESTDAGLAERSASRGESGRQRDRDKPRAACRSRFL